MNTNTFEFFKFKIKLISILSVVSFLITVCFYLIFSLGIFSNHIIINIISALLLLVSLMFIFLILLQYIVAGRSYALYIFHKKSDYNLLILLFRIFVKNAIKEFNYEKKKS